MAPNYPHPGPTLRPSYFSHASPPRYLYLPFLPSKLYFAGSFSLFSLQFSNSTPSGTYISSNFSILMNMNGRNKGISWSSRSRSTHLDDFLIKSEGIESQANFKHILESKFRSE